MLAELADQPAATRKSNQQAARASNRHVRKRKRQREGHISNRNCGITSAQPQAEPETQPQAEPETQPQATCGCSLASWSALPQFRES
jgi:hypothetical protein